MPKVSREKGDCNIHRKSLLPIEGRTDEPLARQNAPTRIRADVATSVSKHGLHASILMHHQTLNILLLLLPRGLLAQNFLGA
jgi:hypothetical protein